MLASPRNDGQSIDNSGNGRDDCNSRGSDSRAGSRDRDPEHALDRAHGAADTGADRTADHAAHRTGDPVTFVGAFLRAAHDALGMSGMGIAPAARERWRPSQARIWPANDRQRGRLDPDLVHLHSLRSRRVSAGGAGLSNAAAAKKLPWRADSQDEPRRDLLAKIVSGASARFGRAAALIAPRRRINDGSAGYWNESRIPGILDAGGRREAVLRDLKARRPKVKCVPSSLLSAR